MPALKLVSHKLCPYVQRAVISLAEKDVPFERIDVDLADKPDWFKAVSPLGKTPVLLVHVPETWSPISRLREALGRSFRVAQRFGGRRQDREGHAPNEIVGDTAIFESAVILEYLEETQGSPLHPVDPLVRAEHRGWIEFGSAVLNDIAGLYASPDETTFDAKRTALREKFMRLERRLTYVPEKWEPVFRKGHAQNSEPWFAGERFSLVDAVFGPVFRYFDAFDRIGDFGMLAGLSNVARWRVALAGRPSVRAAVSPDYPDLLWRFLAARGSHLSRLMADNAKSRSAVAA
jgi:glutathione S-transferase